MALTQRDSRGGYPIFLVLLLSLTLGCSQRRVTPPQMPLAPSIHDQIQQRLQQPYDELFDVAPDLKFNSSDLEAMRRHVRQSQDYCTSNVKASSKTYEQQNNERMAEMC
jgi:hypothetical protein